MIHQYDHRWATYVDGDVIRDVTRDEKMDPHFSPPSSVLGMSISRRSQDWAIGSKTGYWHGEGSQERQMCVRPFTHWFLCSRAEANFDLAFGPTRWSSRFS
jgi:hypothetical protein